MMGQYDFDEQIAFVTLAIGNVYNEKVIMCIESVLKFTSSNLYVVTDDIISLQNKIKFYGDRIIGIDINQYTDFLPLFPNGGFNYNLKGISIYLVSKLTHNSIVFLDADSFLFGWDKSSSRYIAGMSDTILARSVGKLSTKFDSIKDHAATRCKLYEINAYEINTDFTTENLLILCRGNKTNKFIDNWKYLHDILIKHGDQHPRSVALEISIALYNSKVSFIHIDRGVPFADSFRILHQGKIINPNTI